MTDRSTRADLSRALAKAIAYRDCGKAGDARDWAIRLVKLLEAAEILRTDLQ